MLSPKMKNFLTIFAPIIAVILSITSLVFSSLSYRQRQACDKEFCSKILNLVRECVKYNASIEDKDEITHLLNEVEMRSYVLEKGSDKLRSAYVTSQGCIEHALACRQALGEITDLIGMIHTPMPATPLCTLPESLDETLFDSSIRYDLQKLLTVRSRAEVIRHYLKKGAVLYVVYPRGGLEKRSPEQQAIYLNELKTYPNNLIDWVLNTNQIQPDMIGATYFFRGPNKNIYTFSIKSRQANDPQEMSEWGLWLGEISTPQIKKRIENLFDYFQTCQGPAKKNFLL